MAMKRPPQLGLAVRRDCIEPHSLTVAEAAKRLSLSRRHLSDIANYHAGILPEMVIRGYSLVGAIREFEG
jgi:plasmid maintenance system antidote protein VapI